MPCDPHLVGSVRRYGKCSAPKCKTHVRDWQEPVPALTLGSGRLDVVEKSVNSGSCLSSGDDTNLRIVKYRVAYLKLGHLWCLRDVGLVVKGRVYNAFCCMVVKPGFRVEDLKWLSLSLKISDIQWQHHARNTEVRGCVFDCSDNNPIGVTILKQGI